MFGLLTLLWWDESGMALVAHLLPTPQKDPRDSRDQLHSYIFEASRKALRIYYSKETHLLSTFTGPIFNSRADGHHFQMC